MPGALERLAADLEAHPQASGVTSLVVSAAGVVQHFAGWPEISRDTAVFPLEGRGLRFDSAELPPTGPCGWLPGTGALVRTQLLREVPIDPAMTAYYEDNDWSLRVTRRDPGAFRRCREAIVLHHGGDAAPVGRTPRTALAHGRAPDAPTRTSCAATGRSSPTSSRSWCPSCATVAAGSTCRPHACCSRWSRHVEPRWLVAQWQGDGLAPLLRGARLKGLEEEFAAPSGRGPPAGAPRGRSHAATGRGPPAGAQGRDPRGDRGRRLVAAAWSPGAAAASRLPRTRVVDAMSDVRLNGARGQRPDRHVSLAGRTRRPRSIARRSSRSSCPTRSTSAAFPRPCGGALR